MIKAGVMGGAGYTGGEIIRLLLNHPFVDITFAQSESQIGKYAWQAHPDLFGSTDLKFINEKICKADVIFLCKGHGQAARLLEKNIFHKDAKIIDLSQDFRHKENSMHGKRKFAYGLAELNREEIKTSQNVANPGCFATAIQLALLPLARSASAKGEIHIHAVTGGTGAGQSLSPTSHFTWRSANHSTYKEMEHQHEKEIAESLKQVNSTVDYSFIFIPARGNFTRGIHATIYLEYDHSIETANKLFQDFYRDHPFTHLVPFSPDVKQVVNTNHCFLHLQRKKNKLIITSVIDNLLKGAAGQAIQNMNLMFGWNETTGLNLKPSAY